MWHAAAEGVAAARQEFLAVDPVRQIRGVD
jgi:hypothetical protein